MSFILHGQELAYVDEAYNTTRINERTVEVAVAKHLMAKAETVLEVGCVMPHYLPGLPNANHVVVDLYEEFPGVINADVLTYQTEARYDLVLAISTLDHLNSPHEVLQALSAMRKWRKLGGLLLVTLPFDQPFFVGGGPWLDALLVSKFQMGASALWRMDKVDPAQHLWEEVSIFPVHPAGRGYNQASAFANTVYFLMFGDVERWWSKDPFPFRISPQKMLAKQLEETRSSAQSS